MALIFYLSSQSAPLPDLTAHVWDKSIHFVEYGVLAALFCRAFRFEGFRLPVAVLVAAIATSLYGVSDEWHQAYVPMRSSDVHDWIADTIGAGIAAAGYGLVRLYIGRVHFDADRLTDQIH